MEKEYKYHHSDESKAKISNSLKNKPKSEEHKKKLSEAHKGIPRPDLKGKPKPHTEEQKRKISEGLKGTIHSEESKIKASQTLSGRPCPNKGKKQSPEWLEKRKESNKKAYQNKDSNFYINRWEKGKEKFLETKKKNNSFNKSKEELELKEYLISLYGEENVLTTYYEDSRYPFRCDFYIKSEDLFIELNLHFTHGPHPFNSNNKEDLLLLDKWKEKSLTSDFYKVAIEVWTIRDPIKQQKAKENNLNYVTLYPKDKFHDYIAR